MLWAAGWIAAAECPSTGAEPVAICRVLAGQQDAWNRGDWPAFLAAYEQSDQVTFAGRTGVTRGIQAITERYRQAYASKEAMGTLTFTLLEVRLTGSDTALVLGRFALERAAAGGGPASGYFSLVFQKSGGSWKILHDHTS